MFEFLQPPGWAKPSGYANGVAARGKMIFVAGQIGWNEQCKFESDDLVAQVGQALKNVDAVVRAGGAGPEHIVAMTWFQVNGTPVTSAVRSAISLRSVGSPLTIV